MAGTADFPPGRHDEIGRAHSQYRDRGEKLADQSCREVHSGSIYYGNTTVLNAQLQRSPRRWRSNPSCATEATSAPSRAKIRPREKPREPKRLGLSWA